MISKPLLAKSQMLSLDKIKPDSIQTYLCENVAGELSKLGISLGSNMTKGHLVTCQWERLPSQSGLIDNLLDILAQAALGIWPAWYNNNRLFKLMTTQGHTEEIISNFLAANDIAKIQRHVSKSWLKKAVNHCHLSKPPRLKGFPRTVQIRQLALAIDPDQLLVILGTNDDNPSKARMLGLAKASEWIATTAKAGVAVFVPESLAVKKELESILYGAIHLHSFHTQKEAEKVEENKLLIAPVKGRPHPFSPGEKALYERLAKDEELSGLFAFNQTVKTEKQSTYLVDIVWTEGKVVVEVDGYKYHSDQYTFRHDRQRDYELLITGYHVLRLPHDLVMEDAGREIEKIRNVVRFIKKI